MQNNDDKNIEVQKLLSDYLDAKQELEIITSKVNALKESILDVAKETKSDLKEFGGNVYISTIHNLDIESTIKKMEEDGMTIPKVSIPAHEEVDFEMVKAIVSTSRMEKYKVNKESLSVRIKR
jgi:hypothetical protein